jgi:hypothetical protein
VALRDMALFGSETHMSTPTKLIFFCGKMASGKSTRLRVSPHPRMAVRFQPGFERLRFHADHRGRCECLQAYGGCSSLSVLHNRHEETIDPLESQLESFLSFCCGFSTFIHPY